LEANGVALLKCKALGSIFEGYFVSMDMIPLAKQKRRDLTLILRMPSP
jgi:hypothetical protein